MITGSRADPSASAEPLFQLPNVPWPEGTTWYALRTWVALAIALYAAFFLQLEGASSAGVCVLILAQPVQGMVLSKSIYRLAGTIVGVLVALVLTALFPQDRTMLLASFAVFMALQTAIGSILRDFRAYGCILAGYTVAIISIANIDAPTDTLAAAVNRVAAIILGIAAIGCTNAVLATAESSRSLMSKLRTATVDILATARQTFDQRAPLDPAFCIDTSARLMQLRSEISFATPEKPNGRLRAAGGRSALLGLFEMLNAIQAVGTGLHVVKAKSCIIDDAIAIMHKALRLQDPERCVRDLNQLMLPAIVRGSISIEEAYVLDRMHFMLQTLGNVRDGLRSLRMGWRPRRYVSLEVHQDWFAVVINAVRVAVAISVVAVLSIWSGLSITSQTVLFAAVFVSLGAVIPNPNIMGRAALFGMPAVVVVGAIYAFFILPNIDGFPLFIISFVPLVVVMCWLTEIGMPGPGLIFGVMTFVLVAPANVQTLDPASFVDVATMLAFSGFAIFLSLILIFPVYPANRRLRLILAVGTALRRALADESKLPQPRASLQYDRFAQFKTWQGQDAPTLARRKTMCRLVEIGNLAFAVRRSWRSLDACKPFVDPARDAEARKVLPSLSPGATLAVADAYLAAAKNQADQAAHCLVRCAGALYGTALLTRRQWHLLRRVRLVGTTA